MEHQGCEATYEIIKDQFKNGDIIIPFDSDEEVELRGFRHMCGDGYAFTKGYKSVKVYDSKTGQLAKKVGFGVDSNAVHMEHTKRFVEGFVSSDCSTPREYLNKSLGF
jgi:hypothetical protein